MYHRLREKSDFECVCVCVSMCLCLAWGGASRVCGCYFFLNWVDANFGLDLYAVQYLGVVNRVFGRHAVQNMVDGIASVGGYALQNVGDWNHVFGRYTVQIWGDLNDGFHEEAFLMYVFGV